MPVLRVLADALVVLLFAAIGRVSHEEALTVTGVAHTAWPFLAGLGVGWLLLRLVRRSGGKLTEGLALSVMTVGVGMLVRQAIGEGTAPAFVVVATVVVTLLLVGSRLPRRAPTQVA